MNKFLLAWHTWRKFLSGLNLFCRCTRGTFVPESKENRIFVCHLISMTFWGLWKHIWKSFVEHSIFAKEIVWLLLRYFGEAFEYPVSTDIRYKFKPFVYDCVRGDRKAIKGCGVCSSLWFMWIKKNVGIGQITELLAQCKFHRFRWLFL